MPFVEVRGRDRKTDCLVYTPLFALVLISIPNISLASNMKREGFGCRFAKLRPFCRAFTGSHDPCAGAGRRGDERADGWTDEGRGDDVTARL